MTAPTEWVPYVYTEAELRALAGRRGLSVASLVLGLLGLAIAVFGVWGAPVSFVAVVLAIMARRSERSARTIWACGLASGLGGLALAAAWLLIIVQVLTSMGSGVVTP